MDVEGMIDRPEPTRLRSFGRMVNLACFVVLLIIMGTVIYGLILRAVWERNYYVAVAIAILGALVLLIGLAQQEIAARDKATWRAMAEWQIRATYRKLATRWAEQEKQGKPAPTIDSEGYYEELLEVLIEDMQRVTESAERS
ncbi:hypothetical protein [uncultured Novosphingobium sp.]|uniref:hypothetical protein n=1 Tax=uncultured Novosphingobium sp. TaxID=292277 RepID=UPI002589DC39|nr:hypothetical protein [uncultured Novosphingobium sp.]